jgi:hypothetical protein
VRYPRSDEAPSRSLRPPADAVTLRLGTVQLVPVLLLAIGGVAGVALALRAHFLNVAGVVLLGLLAAALTAFSA